MNQIAPARSTNTMAVVSLVFGILSWVMIPAIGAIVAIITGHMARAEIRRNQNQMDGDGMAVAGLVLGYLQLALLIIGVLLLILFFGGIAAIAAFAN